MSPRSTPREGDDSGREVDLTPHRLAPRRTDRKNMPEEGLTTITGFIGEADDNDRIRVYLNMSFDNYVEVARSDVVRTAPVDAQDENSPTILWVGKNVQITMASVGRIPGAGDMLTGGIRSRYGGRGRGRGMRGMLMADPVSDILCSVFCKQPPVRTDNPWECTTYSDDCTAGGPFCG
jgi:hypothetical protein